MFNITERGGRKRERERERERELKRYSHESIRNNRRVRTSVTCQSYYINT